MEFRSHSVRLLLSYESVLQRKCNVQKSFMFQHFIQFIFGWFIICILNARIFCTELALWYSFSIERLLHGRLVEPVRSNLRKTAGTFFVSSNRSNRWKWVAAFYQRRKLFDHNSLRQIPILQSACMHDRLLSLKSDYLPTKMFSSFVHVRSNDDIIHLSRDARFDVQCEYWNGGWDV